MTESRGAIVCALDLERHAAPLLQLASRWARALGAPVELLHVARPDSVSFGSLPVEFATHLREFEARVKLAQSTQRRELERMAQRVLAGGVECEGVVVRGEPATAILERARDVGAALIIMGPHASPIGAEWLERAGVGQRFLGGVASHVLRSASCPVLVACGVEQGAELPAPSGRWVVGLDDSRHADAALEWVSRAVGRASGELLLLNVVERLHELDDPTHGIWAHLRERAEELLDRRVPAHVESRVEIGRPAHVLVESSTSERASMLVVGRGGTAGTRIGRTTRGCLRRANVPVLVVASD